jgi:ABC-type polar amino acid transport system ATPase subunit
MKICKIYIKGYQQFQDVILDFTHPETGEPLDKICLIGSNGTGKTTLINIVKDSLQRLSSPYNSRKNAFLAENPVLTDSVIVVEYFDSGSYFTDFFHFYTDKNGMVNEMSFRYLTKSRVFDANIFHALSTHELTLDYFSKTKDDSQNLPYTVNNQDFLKIFSTFEGKTNGYATIEDVPKTTVNEAIKLFDNLPNEAIVSPDTVNDFWKLLVFNLKKREDDRRIFEETDENMQRIKADLVKEFNGKNPNVLEELAAVWDKILDKAGLFFNFKVKSPVQLHENLHAYICLKGTNTIIPYSQLSSGIRDYIFRVGHIFAMYFNREVDRGILLVDEPDNSLFPDFVLDLLNTYKQITTDKRGENHTQMIFATHNPLFAAQFEPYERIILDWKADGSIMVQKGIAPVGDDPNDLLTEDFGLINLMSAEGQKMWEKYIELKKKLIRSTDMIEKEELVEEINQIATLYKFNLYEIPVEK